MKRLLLLALACLAACHGTGTGTEVEADARAALAAVPGDLARGGPLAWLDHFDDAPEFWMASEGELKFASYAEARAAMEAFGPTIAEMELVWSDVSIDVLTPDLAGFGAGYDELLVDTSGAETRFTGYVTGLLRRTPAGWRIAQLHWSMSKP
jgi:hypothetical protein